jgi:hypothetical protein
MKVATLDKKQDMLVNYVVVDLEAVFPQDRNDTAAVLTQLVQSGQFCNLKQAEGVILLKRCAP